MTVSRDRLERTKGDWRMSCCYYDTIIFVRRAPVEVKRAKTRAMSARLVRDSSLDK